eukprot:8084586-Karenia_brevis.AAC.1
MSTPPRRKDRVMNAHGKAAHSRRPRGMLLLDGHRLKLVREGATPLLPAANYLMHQDQRCISIMSRSGGKIIAPGEGESRPGCSLMGDVDGPVGSTARTVHWVRHEVGAVRAQGDAAC